ncbi:MAG TPA: ABC transporter permease [Streptosporangiaceae bacterium]|nr:ABC transporter permease [Streptosporangiaceae bacterium]
MTDQPRPTPYQRAARRRRIEAVLYPAGALLLALGVWQLVIVVFSIHGYLLPSPGAVYDTLTGQWRYLATESVPTIEEVLLGFAAATVVGIAIAVAIVTWRPFEKAVYPLLVASQEVPQIAFAPLLLVWFGFGLTSKVIIAFLIAFFPVVVNTAAGLRSVPTELLDLAHSTRASGFTILRKIRFPFALPNVFTGLKIGVTFAVIGAVVGEFVGSGDGLGYVLMTANGRLDTATLFAAIGVLVVMGLVLFLAVSLLERLLIPWHVSQRSAGTGQGTGR